MGLPLGSIHAVVGLCVYVKPYMGMCGDIYIYIYISIKKGSCYIYIYIYIYMSIGIRLQRRYVNLWMCIHSVAKYICVSMYT